MTRLSQLGATAFGVLMLALSTLIAVETILRKLLSVSLGGVDELSGYAIAIGAPLAFTIALIEGAHIRINLLYLRMRPGLQAAMNLAAALLMAALALFLLVFTLRTVGETRLYGSIAQTPWATPLIRPQAIWLITMAVFAAAAVLMAARALRLAAARDWPGLNRAFAPDSAEEELQAELDDLDRR